MRLSCSNGGGFGDVEMKRKTYMHRGHLETAASSCQGVIRCSAAGKDFFWSILNSTK